MILRCCASPASFATAALLSACAAPDPPPPRPERLDLSAAPLFAVAGADSDRVYVALRSGRLAAIDAATMQLEPLAATLPTLPNCAAVDTAGRVAIGANDGTALLFDGAGGSWQTGKELAKSTRPVWAIGLLAAPATEPAAPPGAAPTAKSAPAATPPRRAPEPADALIAGFPDSLLRSRFADAPFAPDTQPEMRANSESTTTTSFCVRAIATDAAAARWFVLADGEVKSVESPVPVVEPTLVPIAPAPGARALAWSGSGLVVAGDDGARWLDPATAVSTPLPGARNVRLTQVVASDALGTVAAIDEGGGLWLWRRFADAWSPQPAPTGLPPLRCIALATPSRRLLAFAASDDLAAGSVRRIDLPSAPVLAPAP
jgi:hypothetical protein